MPAAKARMTASHDIEITRDWSAFAPRWEALAGPLRASPFQKSVWLTTWFDAIPGAASADRVRPLLVAVKDRHSGADLMLLPFVERRSSGLDIIEFADLDVTDCNAPAIAATLLDDPVAAADAIHAVREALPACDVLRLTKMPAQIAGRPNPWAAPRVAPVRPFLVSAQPTWSLHVDGSWEQYLKSMERPVRKELGRSLRMCEQMGPTRVVRATTSAEGRAMLDTIDALQRERLALTHTVHVFDTPPVRAFYEGLIRTGIDSGDAVAVSIEIGGERVAGIVGVLDRPRVTVLRIANRSGSYARLGLGRLLLAETFRMLHADGYTHFDMSIGDGDHKRRLGATKDMLVERIEAMSWRGGAAIAARRAKLAVKHRLPRVAAIGRRLRARG